MPEFIRPVKSKKISDNFADHIKRGSVNPGVDYAVAIGTDVFAVADGVVDGTTVTYDGAGGRMIWLNCDGWLVDYLHLSRIFVKKGEKVTRGQVIGKSGASGKGSLKGYGAHLHLSIRKGRKHVQGKGNKDFVAILAAQAAVVPATVAVESTPAQ
jgi:murein DD-endopeptidase MepM/ murein hydrolase activator NlpD